MIHAIYYDEYGRRTSESLEDAFEIYPLLNSKRPRTPQITTEWKKSKRRPSLAERRLGLQDD